MTSFCLLFRKQRVVFFNNNKKNCLRCIHDTCRYGFLGSAWGRRFNLVFQVCELAWTALLYLTGERIGRHLHARTVLPRLSNSTISLSTQNWLPPQSCFDIHIPKTWQLNRITTGVIEAGRPGEVSEPYKLDTKWDFKVIMRCSPGT